MKHFDKKTQGVCSQMISFDLDDDKKVHNVSFMGGCNGNLKAISKLIEGMSAQEISDTLAGNTCGKRPTSCADQLARALTEAVNE